MLLPIYTYERQPIGLFPLMNGITVEGGNVGEIVAGVGRQLGTPVVTLYDDDGADGYGATDDTLNMVGLIDESSTGTKLSGEGNSGMFGKLIEHPFDTSGTHVGPSSTFGSGKCTIWIEPGIFVTDQFADDIDSDTAPMTELYASATGVLTSAAGTNRVGQVLKVFDGGLDNVAVQELLGTLPRVQPLPTNTTLMLFKFK